MNEMQRIKNLSVPSGKIDVVIDTDTYNEVDDQFALSYLLLSPEKLNLKAIYAAPFHNENSSSPEDGMEKSYNEIFKLLDIGGFEEAKKSVFKGSRGYLKSETEPQISPAAEDLAKRAENYSPENPLYVVTIGCITNIASALLINPAIKDNIVVSWLGGSAEQFSGQYEFNMSQDIAAARVVFASGVPLIQLPCKGVVSSFAVSGPELRYWLYGKNKLCDYLVDTVEETVKKYADGKVWSRIIWDVTAVAYLLNEDNRFMEYKITDALAPQYDNTYVTGEHKHKMCIATYINRDPLMQDLFDKLGGAK